MNKKHSYIQQWTLLSSFIFLVLFALTASEPMYWLPNPRSWLDPISEAGINLTATYFWQIEGDFIRQVRSDSLGLWIHTGNLIGLSLLLGLLGLFQPKWNPNKLHYYLRLVIAYYLAFQMLHYGFNKVFKCQFFLPEPNTLFTTVGATSKDLLFWTVMGSSYGYTVFGGVLELIAASLLLHPKSRLAGMLLCAGILSNIVAINFGFNISVKFYSSFFLLLSLIWIAPYGKMLYRFFIHQQLVQPRLWIAPQHPYLRMAKVVLVWSLLLECLSPYIALQNFNDDNFPRPRFHGAYEVVEANSKWQRIFVHRRGYFILQDKEGKMYDYRFSYEEAYQVFLLTDYKNQKQFMLHYQEAKNLLQLNGDLLGQVHLQKIDLDTLPLMSKEIDWRIDAN